MHFRRVKEDNKPVCLQCRVKRGGEKKNLCLETATDLLNRVCCVNAEVFLDNEASIAYKVSVPICSVHCLTNLKGHLSAVF
jgi:hypothetical protein